MTPAQRKQIGILATLLLICILPFALSFYLLHFTDVSKIATSHHGLLIDPPRSIENLRLYNPAAPQSAAFSLHGKWSLAYLLDGRCDADCERNIYKMRQIRLATSKYAHRLQRVIVHAAHDQGRSLFSEQQIKAYQGQLMLPASQLDKTAYEGLFDVDHVDHVYMGEDGGAGKQPYAEGRLYLIDPLGNLMMAYPADADPKGIIKDLKRLLKYSRIG